MLRVKDYTKHFALFAIYLIISLVFFSAQALAAINYRVSGEALVNKWRKADDITIFYVNASANVSIEISPNQWRPMICTQQGNNSVSCEYFLDRNTLGPTVSNVTWKLKQESEPAYYANATIKVDRIPPKIERLNITKIDTALKVSYSVKDYSHQNRPDCSGLDYISYVVGTEADTIEFNTTTCQYNGTVIFNESGFYQEDFVIKIIAKDRLNDPTENTTIITLDLSGPDIQEEWQIMHGGQPIEIFSSNPNAPTIKYDVVIFIDDPKLDINKVRGDLSGLHINPVIKNSLKNKQATCIKETENTYKCIFSEIPIKPATADLKISVNAYDKSNNFANETLQKTVTLLNDAGQVKYIGPLKEHCTASLSKCYTAPGPKKFVGEISLGSNFSFLLFGFSTETTPKVGPCFLKEDKWECVYTYNVPNVSQLKVFIPESSTDIYGNKLIYTERSVLVDSIPPVIIGNITSNLPSCAVASDTLELTLIAKESKSDVLKIHVNTTGLTGAEQTNGTCEKTVNDEWSCTLSITGFVTEHPPEVRKVIVEDLAGNKAEKDFKFEVCAEDENAVPNIITKIKPENDISVDRRTASILPVKTYVPLKITKATGTIIEMTVDNCQGEDENGFNVLDDGHYFIDDTLVLYIGFDGAQLPEEEFDINCTINARVRVGNKIYQKPEVESFIIKAKPYNNPLGIMDSAVMKKIESEKSALRDLDGKIKLWGAINRVFNTLCSLATIIVKINNILQLLKSVIYAICTVMAATVVLAGVAESIWEWAGDVLNTIDRSVQYYVWPTNILSGSTYGNIIKYTCLIYTCQHYKVSGLIEIGSAIVDLIGAAGDQKEKAGEAVSTEKKKQEEQKNQQMYDGTKKYYKDPQGNIHEVYIDKNGNKIAGSDKITTGPPVGELLRYEDVQKMKEITPPPKNVAGGNPGSECNNMLCNNEKSVFFPEEVDGKNSEVTLNPEIIEPKAPPLPTIPIEEPEPPEELPDVLIYEKLGEQFVMRDNGFGIIEKRTIYYLKDKEGNIQLFERSTDIKGNPYGEYKKISSDLITFVNFDAKATADMLWNTQKIGWLGNTHNNGVTYNYEGSMDTNGRYVINVIREHSFLGSTLAKFYEKSIYSAKDLENFLFKEKRRTSAIVTRKSYNVKFFKGGTTSGGNNGVGGVIGGNNGVGGVITDITGRAGGAGKAGEGEDEFSMSFDKMWGNIDDANQQYYERNMKFYSALEAEDWIINPYRSTHWDGLCAPATLYNYQKERQVRCKYLKCMETQLVAGMPSYICDRDFGMDACLYVDSAQWHITGGSFWANIGPGLLKSFLSTLIGIALYTSYSDACSNYLGAMGQGGSIYGGGGVGDGAGGASGAQPTSHTTLVTGWWDVTCGLMGTALQWKEITALGSGDFWSSFFESDIPRDPAEINDYCADVNYNE